MKNNIIKIIPGHTPQNHITPTIAVTPSKPWVIPMIHSLGVYVLYMLRPYQMCQVMSSNL